MILRKAAKVGYLSVVYVSESRDDAIRKILATIVSESTLLAHYFVDIPYNRTGIYLVSKSRESLCDSSLKVCREAFSLIDFRQHSGSHPTLGAVDHISISPLGCPSKELLSSTRELGLEFSRCLNRQEQVDLYFYGDLSERGKSLRSIRKELNYFSANTASITTPTAILPDIEGYPTLRSAKGLTCIGVGQMVVNFNIRMTALSSLDKSAVSEITSLIRVPEAVEALTLRRGDQVEIACNLKSPLIENGPDALLSKAVVLASQRGLTIDTSYTTGPSEKELLAMLYE